MKNTQRLESTVVTTHAGTVSYERFGKLVLIEVKRKKCIDRGEGPVKVLESKDELVVTYKWFRTYELDEIARNDFFDGLVKDELGPEYKEYHACTMSYINWYKGKRTKEFDGQRYKQSAKKDLQNGNFDVILWDDDDWIEGEGYLYDGSGNPVPCVIKFGEDDEFFFIENAKNKKKVREILRADPRVSSIDFEESWNEY